VKLSKKERTQKEIIEAAKAIIHYRGHESITVRSLAEVTGYSHTNLYYHFKDLNALFWTLRFNMIEDMITELTSVSSKKQDPVEEILDAFIRYADYFFAHPNVFRFFYFYPFIQPEGDDRNQKLEQRFQGIWQDSFLRLTQEGIIHSEDVEFVAKTIIYALQGMILMSISANAASQKDTIEYELKNLVTYLLTTDKRKP